MSVLKNIEYIQGDISILETDKSLNILWGVQPRTLPGLEFLIPIIQIVKFIKLGHSVTILLADIHELLDSPKLNLDKIRNRGKAYQILIQLLVELFDANANNICYKFGSDFQLSSDYILDFYKISSLTTIDQTFTAREIDISSTQMNSMIYPILQSLDEKYVNCDIFYGSTTQKNMCKYSENLMKKYCNNKNVLYLLQDLNKKIKISFFDSLDTIQSIIEDFTTEDVEYLYTNILLPLLELRGENVNIQSDKKEMIAQLLSIHLDQFYDNLLASNFNELYYKGWY
jgi:tyrosyl-tRNA synthetase